VVGGALAGVAMGVMMAVRVGAVMVILFRLLPVPLVILCTLPLAAVGSFVALAVSLQAAALPVAVIAAAMWIAYSIGGELYSVALVVAVDSYEPITNNHQQYAAGIAKMSEPSGAMRQHDRCARRHGQHHQGGVVLEAPAVAPARS
jgi:hypothetical protein